MKYKWLVDPPSTGRWRSFKDRGWPSAYYLDEKESIAAYIVCEENYAPWKARSGKHAPLYIKIADYRKPKENCPWTWMRTKQSFSTLKEAKAWFASLIESCPEITPTIQPRKRIKPLPKKEQL